MDMTFNPYGQIHFSSRQDLKRIQAVVRSSFFIVFAQEYIFLSPLTDFGKKSPGYP